MKKLVLVIISALMMTVFIALNYLLWDREYRINLDASKGASIDALGKEIRNLGDENKLLKIKLSGLEDNNKQLQTKAVQMEQDKSQMKDTLQQKEELIFRLKQYMDIKPFEAIIKKWCESIDKGEYDSAYELQSRQLSGQDKAEFANNFKNSVKNIKLKAVKLDLEKISEDHKEDIIFKATLEVKKKDGESKTQLNEGVNERLFSFTFDREKNTWVISGISAVD